MKTTSLHRATAILEALHFSNQHSGKQLMDTHTDSSNVCMGVPAYRNSAMLSSGINSFLKECKLRNRQISAMLATFAPMGSH